MRITSIVFMLLVSNSSRIGAEEAGGRKYQVGVLDYGAVYTSRYLASAKRLKKEVFSFFENAGFKPVTVSPVLFFPKNRAARNQYKRIFIPGMSTCFTLEMYAGMVDYVKSGGLLITNTLLMHADLNGNFAFDSQDKLDNFPVSRLMGVEGRMSGKIKQITPLKTCPVTDGMDVNLKIPLTIAQSGRLVTRNLSATVLIMSNTSGKTGDYTHMPYATFFHIGYGATIFINGNFNARTLKDPVAAKLLMNIMSPKTLGWLCLQNETP